MAAISCAASARPTRRPEIVKGLDLDIHDGEFMVFVGPSGCGKSTLLRMIAGLEDISAGQLRIGDLLANDVARPSGASPWSSRATPCTRT
jgi:ABC-type sugar transport system ATPase subunit